MVVKDFFAGSTDARGNKTIYGAIQTVLWEERR